MRSNRENLETALVVQTQYDKKALLAELADRFAAGDHVSEDAQANVYRLDVLAEAEQDAADARAAERRPLTHRQITSLGVAAIAASALPRSLSGEECVNMIIPPVSVSCMLKDKDSLRKTEKESFHIIPRIANDPIDTQIPHIEHKLNNVLDKDWRPKDRFESIMKPGALGEYEDPWKDPHQPSRPTFFMDPKFDGIDGSASAFGALEFGGKVFVPGLGLVGRDAYERGDYVLPKSTADAALADYLRIRDGLDLPGFDFQAKKNPPLDK